MAQPRQPSLETFPEIVPIFPLSGALLLPRGRLPLNIFESRYLNLIDAALAGGRYMGMVQPLETGRETFEDEARIYGVGCLGRIAAFTETGDGRYVITLVGLNRFRVGNELDLEDGYRRVRADYGDFADDLEPAGEAGFERQSFVQLLKRYIEDQGLEAAWDSLENADDEALVTAVAMSLPLSPQEKQALLESPSLAERGALLSSMIEMAAAGPNMESAPVRH